MEWAGWWCRVREIRRAYFKHYRVRVCASTACESWDAGAVECLCGVWSPKTLAGINTKRNEKLLLQPNPEERSQVNPQTKLITSPAYIYRSRPRAPRRGGVIQPLPRTPPSTPNKTHYPCHGRPCRAAPRRATRAAPCVTHAEYTQRALLSDRRPHLCGGQRLQQWRVFSDGHRLLGRRWGEGGRELSDR